MHPWIHNNCNPLSNNDELELVTFPYIHPTRFIINSAKVTEGFSTCGCDSVEAYNARCQDASWDAVVTFSVLDTAHNIVEYIKIISKFITDGGVFSKKSPVYFKAFGTCTVFCRSGLIWVHFYIICRCI